MFDNKKKTTTSTTFSVPYCFDSADATQAAETAVNAKFDFGSGIKAYSTERVLYVPSNKSLSFSLLVESFIRNLGGRKHTG